MVLVGLHGVFFDLVGADIMGTLECSGIGMPLTEVPVETAKFVPEDCMLRNKVGMCARPGLCNSDWYYVVGTSGQSAGLRSCQ